MRSGVGGDTQWTNALAAQGITTGLLARFEFASGNSFIWTGPYGLQVNGTGDTLLDGNTFQPIAEGVLIDIGANQFNMTGSEAMPLTMAIPATPNTAMANSSHDPTEWQGRTCVLWRTVMVTPPNATTPSQWTFARVRAGTMDQLKISNDGQNHTFSMTVEAHSAMISNATNSTYLEQKTRYDSTDTSQDYATSIANNPNFPQRGSTGSNASTGGRGGGLDRYNTHLV